MRRTKIVEQILIIILLAVLIPFITAGFIISNVSQQSVRSELANSTSLMAEFIGDAIENYVSFSQSQLNQMASGFNYIPDTLAKIQYFNDIETKTKLFKNLEILEAKELPKEKYDSKNLRLTLNSPIDKDGNYHLVAEINVNIIDTLLGKDNTKGRHVYVFDSNTRELIVTNAPKNTADSVLEGLNISDEVKMTIFGDVKNTPKVYFKISNPEWFVVADTTAKVTAGTIIKARYRIILSLSIAALSIIIIVCLYTSYLYVNIRQLFKGITAVSKGNYDKKIHLVKSIFTPYEIVFIAKEFNYMAKKINISYKDLKKKNVELEKLNEYRENLVNSTSHEFRTPLTSIIGYTSRLLRSDIQLDEKTKIKSLQIIKQQAQRLSGMVEDLLVIPELESLSLKYNIEEIDVVEILNRSCEYLKNEKVEFITNFEENINYVFADEYRLEQIFINLIDNAIKYSKDNQPIEITAKMEENTPLIEIKNKTEEISTENKGKLFEKFTRVDSTLTRTTRGTGLGLYIVKNLCEAMKITIDLNTDNDFVISLRFNDYVK